MTIQKNFLKTRPSCKVKFQLSEEEIRGASTVYLAGDFNNWNEHSHPLKKKKDGTLYLEVELSLGHDYQFRYRTDTGEWFNDAGGDAFVPCGFAKTENFLIKV